MNHKLREKINFVRPFARFRFVFPLICVLTLIFFFNAEPEAQKDDSSSQSERKVSLEQLKSKVLLLDPPSQSLIPPPVDKIPDYTMHSFLHSAARNEILQWKIRSEVAHIYDRGNFIHFKKVRVTVLHPTRPPTIITASEGRYLESEENLEFRGDVQTVFPDGFVVLSQYLLYMPNQKRIEIPLEEKVEGNGQEDPEYITHFTSYGMETDILSNTLELLSKVHVSMIRRNEVVSPEKRGVATETHIYSDRAVVNRATQHARFFMNQAFTPKEIARQMVRVKQPSLDMKSRTVDLYFGELDKRLSYLLAKGDIYLKEYADEGVLREAESQDAAFHSRENQVVMTTYPQLYQNDCTINGESITIFPNTHRFEATHSNAICKNQGPNPKKN